MVQIRARLYSKHLFSHKYLVQGEWDFMMSQNNPWWWGWGLAPLKHMAAQDQSSVNKEREMAVGQAFNNVHYRVNKNMKGLSG